ncbi:BTB/POZ domain-containing protein At4g08455-like [Durio zibethinus]|uniref:BTB/POZ domain-containing protein At4g08455-like n=1 Tax=Durio zibethinus TaxID=66656 RepID=A0A6P6B5M8_DURZI|nr:BTB/POZ domain-containing protein At4g08455-like [Durio zibethinus]
MWGRPYDETNMVFSCMLCRRRERERCICENCYVRIMNQHNREINDLKAKVAFLSFWYPPNDDDAHHDSTHPALFFPDVMLVTSCSDDFSGSPPDPIHAHKAILADRSPVFKEMFENEMKESKTGTIKINDASNDAVRAFVNYMYTAEALVDENMGCALLVLAEKYMVKHLKDYCEKFLSTKLNWENSLNRYAFAHHNNAKLLLESALRIILNNMNMLTQREEYKEFVEKDPLLVVEIYEAYLSKLLND